MAVYSEFDVPFNGGLYRNLYVSTNGYITFGMPYSGSANLGATYPPVPTLFLFGADLMAQAIVNSGNSSYLWIRYEGYPVGPPPPATPNMIYEVSSG
jgi:hypothetical protein